eukprot:TRINITY_DN315_c1_g1_i1.p1 TRINITY_DN315_c1_g1~~TRINITY_DN315_c1_g1_i1.p1  ORF type:complete len:664 (-),score=184.96 TRINITY_DN315_c1_g1_i1:146-1963(-)
MSGRQKKQASFGPCHIDADEIILHKKIGEGCFGTVYEGDCRTLKVAVKVPRRQRLSRQGLEAFKKEVMMMSKIYHPNVCLFMGACAIPGSIRIVTELMKADVETLNRKEKDQHLSLAGRLGWARDAAQGVTWLHGNNPPVIHRDLKVGNMLVDENGRIKVCDFGLSDIKAEEEGLFDAQPKGTPLYMAPEVMMGLEITEKVDVYSFGIILWELLTRGEAFSHHSSYDAFYRAVCHSHERPPLPDDCEPSLRNLMVKCWAAKPDDRPDFPSIVKELEQVIDNVKKIERKAEIAKKVEDAQGAAFWEKTFFDQDDVNWSDFVTPFYAHIGVKEPIDPSEETLPDKPTPMQMRIASKKQLAKFGLKSSTAAQQAQAEITRRAMEEEQMQGYGVSAYVAEEASVVLNEDTRRMYCLKTMLVTPAPSGSDAEDTVSIAQFGKVIGWFGPLCVPYKEGGLLCKVEEILRKAWFHGNVSTRDCENALKLQPKGSFLVRFSNSSRNSLCISKTSANKTIKHIVIPHEAPKGYKLDNYHFPTVAALITAAKDRYTLKSPCPGSKYGWLFEDLPDEDAASKHVDDDDSESDNDDDFDSGGADVGGITAGMDGLHA